MTKHELIEILSALPGDDEELEHIAADQALLEFIDDPEITAAFNAVHKWYA